MPPVAPEGGFALIWRKFAEHPYWTEPRVFNRAEAWLDCWFVMAAYEAHDRLIGGTVVHLERGEFIASDRFLERRWRWSRGRVRRFVENAIANGELVREREVNGGRAEIGTGCGTVYSIANYDTYQPRGTGDDTTKRPATDQQRTKEKQGKAREANTPPIKWRVVPANWQPNDGHRAKAAELGLNFDIQVALYRAHDFDRPKADPDKTFTNWLTRAANWGEGKRKGAGKPRPQQYDYSNETTLFQGFTA